MAKNKGTRILITLECTECRSNLNKRSPGISRYSTQKNRRNNPERLQFGQYFFNSNLSGLFRRFFCVVYLDTPGERLFKFERHSVHSKVIKIRVPLFFAIEI